MVNRYVHHRGKLAYGNELCEFERLALCSLLCALFVETLQSGISFLLTILGTLLILVFAGETGQRFLYLTCHIFLVYFERPLVSVVLFVFLRRITAAIGIVSSAGIVVLVTIVVGTWLIGRSVNVYPFLIDTRPFLAFAALLVLVFAFLSFFFFRLFLRTCVLIESREIYLTQHIHLRSCLLLALQGEDFRTGSCRCRFFRWFCSRRWGLFCRRSLCLDRLFGDL